MFLALSLAVTVSSAQEGGDLQAQILYAFHAEDSNQLANLVQTLNTQVKSGGADAALHYHLAHAEYRFGLLAGPSRSHDAETAFGRCIDELKAVLEQDVKSAEAMVLESACYANLAKYKHLEAVLLRSRASDRASCISPPSTDLPAPNRVPRRISGHSRSYSLPLSSSISPPPPASMRRAGGMRRLIWRLACNCSRGAIFWAPAIGSRNP
jgi:hypothetical protein